MDATACLLIRYVEDHPEHPGEQIATKDIRGCPLPRVGEHIWLDDEIFEVCGILHDGYDRGDVIETPHIVVSVTDRTPDDAPTSLGTLNEEMM